MIPSLFLWVDCTDAWHLGQTRPSRPEADQDLDEGERSSDGGAPVVGRLDGTALQPRRWHGSL
jgi:hypothetical protein